MVAPNHTLAAWLDRRVSQTPNKPALTFEGETWTYANFADRTKKVAALLRAGGVQHGDRVAYLAFNHPTFLESMFACARLGAIFVPLNFRLTGPELAFMLDDAGVHTLIVGPDHRAIIDGVRSDVPVERWIGVEGGPEGWEDYEELLAASTAIDDIAVTDAEDTALIMYTSGTTGHPKGAMLTHANIWWNNTGTMLTGEYTDNETSLVIAPLFHIGGLNVTTLVVMQRGGRIILHRHFDPAAAIEAIETYEVSSLFGVPAMFLFMSQLPQFDTADLSSIRVTICGGAPVPEPLMKRYAGIGVPFQQGYGLTETSPSLTVLTKEHTAARLGSAGRPVFFMDMKLMAEDGSTVTEPFTKGEICARGPNIMKGYWNRPEATAEAIDPDGWFRTGDAGYVDEDGFYFVVDRVKDMVISGGENVYPAEVEEALLGHEAITEVAVIGTPSEQWGEAVCAVVHLVAGSTLSLDELRAYAEDHLARYKLPTRLEVVDEIPHNASGKMLKRELRDRFA
ncbi:MAG: long-chain fatty acid--CoA ligase [Acidimicrobiales bacterium]|nr:long-chain fatty acid--CoA ligase [Acidimicrobiales bacterium]RZV40865.1 MAG: long-chain-fatty-acid--CoA ligase [Acidimicrobiales bacterium]